MFETVHAEVDGPGKLQEYGFTVSDVCVMTYGKGSCAEFGAGECLLV